MAVRKGLGRGLDLLIPKDESMPKKSTGKNKDTQEVAGNQILTLSIHDVEPNRNQPRKQFDEDAIEELADSIKQYGVIQPLIVHKKDKYYEIIAGERRFRACVLAGFDKVTCYIMDPSEQSAAQMALVENIQRENLTAIEEAKAYIQIMRQSNLTQDMLAKKLGKSQSTIANKIRLLNLPMEIQEGVSSKIITERHARALLSVDSDKQVDTYRKIVDKHLNVRQTEEYVEELVNKPKKKKQVTKGFTRNIQIGINSINQCLDMIRKIGIVVTSEMEDDDNNVKIIIKFPK